jgi:uncharacterized protein
VILYADTSAVVKTVLEEVGTARVREWFAQADQVVSSVITYPEACSALCRAHRLGGSAAGDLSSLVAELDVQWAEFIVLEVVAEAAGRVALDHGLRGMDAVQLSTAIVLRTAVVPQAPGADIVFAAFDRRLLEAAAREGFATLGGPLT